MTKEICMECALTLMTISAGLLLSIACATLIEELFIGGLFRIFFAPRPARPPQQKQAKPGHIVTNGMPQHAKEFPNKPVVGLLGRNSRRAGEPGGR